jgi:hypothetical protein
MTDQTGTIPDHITVSRDQLAALLAHHADVIAARWDAYAPDPAAYALRTHAGELTAEEETPAVAGLLDSMMSFSAPVAARQAAGQPAADCPACDAGIEHTEHCPTPETHNWGCGCATDQMPTRSRQAAEAILHNAMDHGVKDEAIRQQLIDQLAEACRHEAALRPLEQPTPAVGGQDAGQPADRAAAYNEAADEFEDDRRYMARFFGHQVAAELRRMADEATTP